MVSLENYWKKVKKIIVTSDFDKTDKLTVDKLTQLTVNSLAKWNFLFSPVSYFFSLVFFQFRIFFSIVFSCTWKKQVGVNSLLLRLKKFKLIICNNIQFTVNSLIRLSHVQKTTILKKYDTEKYDTGETKKAFSCSIVILKYLS